MAIDAFMKIDDLVGGSEDEKHPKEIEVLSWSWGMSQLGSMHSGSGGGAGKVSVQDLSFVKTVDNCSPNLIQYCCSGQHFKLATLTLRKAGGKAAVEYLIIKLEDLIVSNYSTGGSGEGGEIIHENVTVNFARFQVQFTPQGAAGTGTGKVNVCYDVQKNKVT